MTADSALVLPSVDDPMVAGLSGGLGGPPGRYARLQDHRVWWTALRVLIGLTILTCTLGWAQKEQCRNVGNWSWNGGVYQYTRVCYSDVVALYGAEGISNDEVPYVDHPVEYPVLTGTLMGAVGWVVDQSPAHGIQRDALDYDLTVLVLGAGAVVTVIATGLTQRRRIWDAALIALAPTLILHLGTNWDMLAVTFASLALLAWSRKRLGWAGVLLGLATAAKLYPALFFLPLLALCLRSGQLRAWAKTAGIGLATFVIVNAPFWIASPKFADAQGSDGKYAILAPSPWQALRHGGVGDFLHALWPNFHDSTGAVTGRNGVMRFWHLNKTRGADWDSLWLLISNARSGTDTWLGDKLEWITHQDPGQSSPTHLNLVVEVGFVLVTIGVFWVALRAPRRPRLAQLLFIEVAGFMLVNKVDSPQYTLWLLPLAALALPRWRIFLAWQLSEVVLTIARFQYFVALDKSGPNQKGGIPYPWFGTTVVIRDALIVTMIVMILRQVWNPSSDPVRAEGVDDPVGGVLEDAEDVDLLTGRVPVGPAPELTPV